MQVIKITSDDSLKWELLDFNSRNYLSISYAPEDQHSLNARVYCVNSDMYSVRELVEQIPVWANENKTDSLAIYSKNSDKVNDELINALKQMKLIHPTGLNNHEFYFIKAYIFCENVSLA